MHPGRTKVIACPKCGGLMQKQTWASGNSFGSVVWSDGKCVGPMIPEEITVTKCAHCNSIFWIEDALTIGVHGWERVLDIPVTQVPVEWKSAPVAQWLDYRGLADATQCVSSAEREKFLRTALWHELNDAHRRPSHVGLSEEKAHLFRSNLEALLPMLDDEEPRGCLLKAEALRELGRHSEAIPILADVPKGFDVAAAQIMGLAQAGHTTVVPLTKEALESIAHEEHLLIWSVMIANEEGISLAEARPTAEKKLADQRRLRGAIGDIWM